MIRLAPIAVVLGLVVAGCADDDQDPAAATGKVSVVATTTHLADLARNVGGDDVEVTSLLTPTADPHDYEVRPADVETLSQADLVLRSGGDIDAWLGEAIEGSGTEAPVLDLLEHVRTVEGDHHHAEGEERHAEGEERHAEQSHAGEAEGVDPHWWQDPRNAQRAVTEIRDALIAADPGSRATYSRNAAVYLRELRDLDTAIAGCLREIPQDQRKLVTTHGSFGYYADRYDIEVIGTVIPSLSTQAQPSAGAVDELVETIRRERVSAIFTEQAVDPDVERAIAGEAGARIGTPLWADSLGPQGSDGETYLEALAANTRALAEGLSDGAVTCRLPS